MDDKFDLLRRRRELIRQRELHVIKVRQRYAARIVAVNLQLERLREQEADRKPKGTALERYTEGSDSPARTCKECGEVLIRASLDNARDVEEISDRLLIEHYGTKRCTRTDPGWASVRQLAIAEWCCHGCRHKKGYHSVYCMSTTQIDRRRKEFCDADAPVVDAQLQR